MSMERRGGLTKRIERKAMFSRLFGAVVTLLMIASAPHTVAEVCEDAEILGTSLITNVCWDCMFPLKIAGVTLAAGDRSNPPESTSQALCSCTRNGIPEPGVVMSMWEPARLVEFPRQAGCSPTLGGVQLGADPQFIGGKKQGAIETSYYHYHYFSFPLFVIMELFSPSSCHDGYLDIDLMYLSEIDPTWNNSELAFFLTPEAAMVSNPIAGAACPADAVAATAGWPLDSLWWCAGSWGSMYPLSGVKFGSHGVIRSSSLFNARVLASLHRKGFARKTMGNGALCEPKIEPMIPKSQYKFSLMYPRAETDRAHVLGESVARWGLGRTIPGVSTTPVYLNWRLNDCCNTL